MKLSNEALQELKAFFLKQGIIFTDEEVVTYGLDFLKYTHMMTKDVEIKKYLDFTNHET